MANGILECIIFNVEHGLSVFFNSPNGYNLLIDCGGRARFSPIKWVRSNYSTTVQNNSLAAEPFDRKTFAKLILSHIHFDHYSDIGSFTSNDGPARFLRDKQTINQVKEEVKDTSDDSIKSTMETLLSMSDRYSQTASTSIDWGFEVVSHQLGYDEAKKINEEKLVNNRSFITSVSYKGLKILVPGDIETDGWKEALTQEKFQNLVAGTNFFVASHHGHKSGFTSSIINHSGKPDLFIISANAGDEKVDTSYSKEDYCKGYEIDGKKRYMVSTREEAKSIKITINSQGRTCVEFIDCVDNLNDRQLKKRDKNTKKVTSEYNLP